MPRFYIYLSEGATQFDVRRCWELSLGAHGERAGLQAVKVGHDQQQVRRGFDRQEAAAGYIDAQGVVKAFDGGTDRRLQLDDILPTVERLIRAKKKKRRRKCGDFVKKV